MNPELEDLYAGMSGFSLIPDRFELGNGVVISRTYAHLMAPFLMAFAPAPPGKAPPAPWSAVKGGLGFDIGAQLHIPLAYQPQYLDRLNTIWWLTALLRLKVNTHVFVPIVTSQKFEDIPTSKQQPELWPMEVHIARLWPDQVQAPRVDVPDLNWLSGIWESASRLLLHSGFSVAFQAVDGSVWNRSAALATVAVWGALERLMSGPTQELSFRVSANIASFLEHSGRERYECFKQVRGLYSERSRAAHGDHDSAVEPYEKSYMIARRVLLRIIENGRVPDKQELEAALFGGELNC